MFFQDLGLNCPLFSLAGTVGLVLVDYISDANCITGEKKPGDASGSAPSPSDPNSLGPEVICSQLGIVDLDDQPVVLRFDAQDLRKESRLSDSLFSDHLWPRVKRSPVGWVQTATSPWTNTNSQTCKGCLCGAGPEVGVQTEHIKKIILFCQMRCLARSKQKDLESKPENNDWL